ncbi:hypothetical protein C8F04DRAFT_166492 [Mycena alexandri]|uniref:NADAR domain-containing protein n=1 Tax=Mycena alexandri TaxID=1745969 RepID=A0AAD6SAJ8_9AGAR|nr:hypothetical protein C8F04DRAFT_166492 [Mycena alexandri]
MISSSLQTILDVILMVTPVPGLSAAFHLLKLIVSAVQQASKSKARLLVLAQSAAQLLETLNAEFRASRLSQSTCARPLADLHSLLTDIQSFVQEERARPFFKVLWTQDARMEGIDAFYRRIGTVADAFQISALLNIQRMLSNDATARTQDSEGINVRLSTLEQNQTQIWRTLGHGSQAAIPFPPSSNIYGLPVVTVGNSHQRYAPQPYVWWSSGGQTALVGQPAPPGITVNPAAGAAADRQLLLEPKRQRQRFFINLDFEAGPFRTRSPHPVKYNGKEYPTAEHLFQAFKYMDNRPDIAERIRTISQSPNKAFRYSMTQLEHQHLDWDRMCTAKMEIANWHKFAQHPELKKQLLATGDMELVHCSKTEYWGVGKNGRGRNELGKALERVRSSLSEK